LAGTPVSEASESAGAIFNLFCEARTSRLLILGLFALAASLTSSLAGAQTIFNCPTGWVSTLAASCGVGFGGVNGPGTFQVTGTPNGYPAVLSGTQVELAIPTADHIGLNLNYWYQQVGVKAFTTTYTFIPNGWNISLVLNNNTNTVGGQNASGHNFQGGAGCEGSFFQAFNNPNPYNPPNNIFVVMLNSWSPLADSNGSFEGGGSAPFTYSGTQMFQQGQDPCNPRDGTEPHYYLTQYVSTSPVNLTTGTGYGPGCAPSSGYSAVNGCGTTTGDDYSVTVTYTGSNVTERMYNITAGGSCPGASCFTHTWNNVSIPSMVNGTSAWAGFAASTNAPSGKALYVNSWTYTVLSAADTPNFSPAGATYSSTQSVTISDGSSGSIICYNTTGNPSTNGIGGCANGTLYSGAISVVKGQTLYAVAGGGTSSYGDSAVASAAYVITGYGSSPIFSVSSGAYQGNQTLILAAAQGGVICYNTTGSPATNGSTGCTTGTLYTGPITISSNETVYAVAGGTGFTDSAVNSAAYTISPFWGTYADSPVPPATPTFSPLPGTYSGTQTVTLSTATAAGYICYETSATPLVVLPYPDSRGGCAVGTLYSSPISVASNQIVYATAGVPNTGYTYGGTAPSSPTAGTYIIGATQTPPPPTNVQGTVVVQ